MFVAMETGQDNLETEGHDHLGQCPVRWRKLKCCGSGI